MDSSISERALAPVHPTPASSIMPVAQIVISYRGTILDVVHLQPGAQPFTIGESPAASFKLDASELADQAATVLVAQHGQRWLLSVPAGFELQGLESSPRVQLQPGVRMVLRRGELRFDIALVERARVEDRRAPIDRPFWASVLGTAAVATTAFMLLRAMPPDGLALAREDADAAARFASYFQQADMPVEPEQAEQAELVSDAHAPASGGKPGERASGREGKARGATKHAVPRPGPRAGMPGLGRNGSPDTAAATAGILGVLAASDRSFLASAEGAFGSSEADALLWANASGLSGSGLGLTNDGRGGGGTASSLASLGAVGPIGSGTGSSGLDYGHDVRHGDRDPKRVAIAQPRDPSTSSNIDKEVVRRIIRSHINEVRSCYNEGLGRNPNLAGRVTVQFTVLGTGKVGSSVVEHNDTRDSKVGECIAKVVKRWKFPTIRGGGTALISYPFVLRTT